MLLRPKIKKRFGVILLFLTIIIFIVLPLLLPINFTSNNDQLIIKPSGETYYTDVLWLDNPTFEDPIEPIWIPDIEGDESDVGTSTSPGQANLIINGESREKQVLLNTATQSSWKAFNKSDLVIIPQRASVPYYGIDDDGCWCSHWWWELESGGQPKNTPRMHWKTNVSLPVDMSDYVITSLSFSAIINASVDPDIDTPNDRYARPGVFINQFETYDYAQFYVEISTLDIDELNTYRIAFNQTRLLGNDSLLLYDIEGLIGVFDEQAIIDALNSVLEVDPGHNNFTIVLGIYMYCEDNYSGNDRDHWDDLHFKTLDLTFTYEKKISQSTSVSWNQNLNEINGSSVQITGANLKFNYKIDQNWTESSQNSKILIYINDRKFDPTIYLIDYIYSSSFQEANSEGFDISSKILPYENFTISIQVFLADDFELDHDITISITDVYLYISYKEYFADIFSEPWIFAGLFIIAIFGAAILASYLIAYQTYLKYPVPVRKVRKYRKTLIKEKDPGIRIIKRKSSFKKIFQNELDNTSKFLKGPPLNGKILREKLLVNQQEGIKSEK